MKQRLTFLAPEGSFIDVKDISLTDNVFNFNASSAFTEVERRYTLSLEELPTTLRSHLRDVHELHLRWTSSLEYSHLSPLVSRQPPGLHAFFTPRDGKKGDRICSSLQWLFQEDMKCETVTDSFSRAAVLSERFASGATYQLYHYQASLQHLVHRLRDVCTTLPSKHASSCQAQVSTLDTAREVHLDFDVISHALVITGIWSQDTSVSSIEGHPHSKIDSKDFDGTVEVGIFSAEKADEHEELRLGGYLAVLGENKKPSATMFSFPSRHHPLPANDKTTYDATYLPPTGLHPKLSLSFPPSTLKPPHETCALHAYLTLPSALFLDRYQLSESALLAENNLRALRALSGAEDLEAPDWAVKQWGSASLFELAHPVRSSSSSWTVQIPLHLRYLQSSNDTSSSSRHLVLPSPIVFWACEAEEGLKMHTNPFDRVHLGYDSLFGPKTMFHHVPPAQKDLTLLLDVPTLDPATGTWLSPATLAVVLAGLAWVLWSLLGPLSRQSKVGKKE